MIQHLCRQIIWHKSLQEFEIAQHIKFKPTYYIYKFPYIHIVTAVCISLHKKPITNCVRFCLDKTITLNYSQNMQTPNKNWTRIAVRTVRQSSGQSESDRFGELSNLNKVVKYTFPQWKCSWMLESIRTKSLI